MKDQNVNAVEGINNYNALRLFESQGDWKGALRAGKELTLEVSTACWNSFNSLHFKSFHSKNPFHPALSAKVRGSFPYEVSLLCPASFLFTLYAFICVIFFSITVIV